MNMWLGCIRFCSAFTVIVVVAFVVAACLFTSSVSYLYLSQHKTEK